MEYLVVDGYNVINAWGNIFNLEKEPLEDCRERLLNMLSNYQGYRKIEVIVVFDAHHTGEKHRKLGSHDNLTVVFTKEFETADNYIERFVYTMSADNTIWVVTSDYLEQRMVLKGGGVRLTPKELLAQMDLAGRKAKKEVNRAVSKSPNTIMSNVSREMMEILEKMRREK